MSKSDISHRYVCESCGKTRFSTSPGQHECLECAMTREADERAHAIRQTYNKKESNRE